jgi:hypothetical protein
LTSTESIKSFLDQPNHFPMATDNNNDNSNDDSDDYCDDDDNSSDGNDLADKTVNALTTE